MNLSLTNIGYTLTDTEGKTLAEISYTSDNNVTVKVGTQSLTFPSNHIDTLRTLLEQVKKQLPPTNV